MADATGGTGPPYDNSSFTQQVGNVAGTGLPNWTPGQDPFSATAGYMANEDAAQGNSNNQLQNFKLMGSPADYMVLLGLAETFAASTGYKNAPSLALINQMLKDGWANLDPYQVYSRYAQEHGTATSMPWSVYGMTKQQYTDTTNGMQDAFANWTGTRAIDPGLQQRMMTERWSNQRLQEFLQNDKGMQGKYGWLKFGMAYNDFQQYKINNRAQAMQRFGPHLADTNYFSLISDPLTTSNQQGQPTQQAAGQKENAVRGAFQSSVR